MVQIIILCSLLAQAEAPAKPEGGENTQPAPGAGAESDKKAAAKKEAAAAADKKKSDDTKTDDTKTDDTKTDDTKTDDTKTDDTKTDDAKADDTKTDDAKADDAKADDAKANDAKADDAKTDDAKADDAKTDDAKADDTKADDAKADDIKPEDRVSPRPANEEAAQFKHAEAIDAELDGDFRRALTLMREATGLDPTNEIIQFDLARLAMLRGGTSEDLEAFFANTDKGPAAQELRRAVAARLKRDLPDDELPWTPPKWLSAGVATGFLIDSNVSVVPPNRGTAESDLVVQSDGDEHSEKLGARYTFDGALIFRPLRKRLAIDAGFLFNLGKYVNGDDLAPYDSAAFTLLGVMRADYEPILFRLSLTGTEMSSNGFSVHYAHWAIVDADLRFAVADGHIGFYTLARIHEYVGTQPNPGDYDRDGGQVGGGLSFDWMGSEHLNFRGRTGLTYNIAPDGPEVRYQAAHLSVAANIKVWRFEGSVGLRTEGRVYKKIDFQDLGQDDTRIDLRITPHLKVYMNIWHYIGVYAGYSYTGNFSTSDASATVVGNFSYQRHIATFGVEGRL